ncbi:MAG TPA: SulP family inorganic anion transporter [Nocardioides sp.]|uniref:SulP family inorganic anion transporter n=1 Tax=Nocardioides sp. TaxID=35761 RepID=UPI002C04A220|nr:SulP family inorganic anion transporter [Nocardioides sp.]HQR26909.1 SulP family inorganic anion transporter [Nocardioides sp.]
MAHASTRLPVLQGILPLARSRLPMDVAAGITLAALGIPEVMGYTSIAGMPVITGLYTILIPIAVFALLGSSRHLVVGADSATAAIMAAGLAGMAATASSEYVALAGMLAIATGGLLVLARLLRLGFIANFLSRSVLVGFLTGVGIQVAMGQVGDMLGVPAQSGGTIEKLVATLGDLGQGNGPTVLVSAAVIAVILGSKAISPRIPGALIAVVGAIVVSWQQDLAAQGVATLGPVPSGLPQLAVPSVTWSQFTALLGTAGAIFIVVLAQSAATSRAYAAKYEEPFDENVDLVGLGVANATAGLSGAFVVNGSPTKTQMVDGAGGRSQVASLTTAVIVLVVLLFLTKPLQYMPTAVLASVVFLIGIELVDLVGLRGILRMRPDEFVIAVLTGLLVVVVGVEQAILVAVIVSVIDHLRRSYAPRDSVLVEGRGGHYRSRPVADAGQLVPGVVVYRFGSGLYYANATRFQEEVLGLVDGADPQSPVRCVVLSASAIVDVDYTGGLTLRQVASELHDRGVRLVLADLADGVRPELDRFGVTDQVGADAYTESVGEAVERFRSTQPGG